MPGFPDKFMPFMDEPPGARLSTQAVAMYGRTVHSLRQFTRASMNREPDGDNPRFRPATPRLSARFALVPASNFELAPPMSRNAIAKLRRLCQVPVGGNVLGSDHAGRGQLGDPRQNRFRQPPGVECHSTSSIFRGYSVFMRGKDPARRPFHHQPHLRNLRRQPRHLRLLCPEHGLPSPPAASGRVDHQSGRSRRVHVRPQFVSGQPGRRGLLRANRQRDQPPGALAGGTHLRPPLGDSRIQNDRRHHAVAQSLSLANCTAKLCR